ncbi:hypothetical protein OV450_1385 [Actinobacteria bacterium OV450]|nr:hypothetical protein OV450_1385 [Actinobacteria bacterium OV450]
MNDLQIATCTFQEFQPHMGTPVRTTVGRPRFSLPYPMTAHAHLVTPTRELLKINAQDAYEFQYRRLLNARGIDAIRDELMRIAGAYDLDSPLVLLCFDQLAKLTPPNNWCHRLHFAKWWTEQTGDEVPELGAVHQNAPHQGGLW